MISNSIVQNTAKGIANILEITLLKQSLPIIVVILVLTAVYFVDLFTNQNEYDSLRANQCYLTTYNCKFEIEDRNFNVEFDRFPLEIEEMMSITFTHSANFTYDSGWVEGTNMFMGKMKLFTSSIIEHDPISQVELELFLGACSEPQMRWKMVLNLTHVESGIPQRLIIFFQTDQS